jgi:hypothetical protein
MMERRYFTIGESMESTCHLELEKGVKWRSNSIGTFKKYHSHIYNNFSYKAPFQINN